MLLTDVGCTAGTSATADVRVYLVSHSQSPQLTTSVSSVGAAQIVCTVAGMTDAHSGTLLAMITVQGIKSSAVQVANVIKTGPQVFSNQQKRIARSASGNRLHISGIRFGTDQSALTTTVEIGGTVVSSTVAQCTDVFIAIVLASSTAANAGDIKVRVARTGFSESPPIAVGHMVYPLSGSPAVTVSTTNHPACDQRLYVHGTNFATSGGDIDFELTPSAGPQMVASVDLAVELSPSRFAIMLSQVSDANAGALQATVIIKGVAASTVAVATVTAATPSITSSTDGMAQSHSGNRLTFSGSNFGTDSSRLVTTITGVSIVEVVFRSDTMIWVETSDTSTLALGALTASVSHDLYGAYGGLIQVGTVVSAISVPTIVGQTTTLLSNATTLTFDTTNAGSTAADMKLYLSAQFQPDTPILATITAVSGSTVTASLSGMTDIHVGMLNAMMTVKGVKSLTAQVGVVALVKPSITPGFFQIAKSGTGNRIEVAGIRFGSDAGLVSIVLAPAVAGASIVYCSDELLVVDIGDTNSLSTTTMTATVTRTDSGGTQVSDTIQVGSIVSTVSAPALTASISAISSSVTSLQVFGSNLGTDNTDARAYLAPQNSPLVPVRVIGVGADVLRMSTDYITDAHVGVLQAIVTYQGVASAASDAATINASCPLITSSAEEIARTSAGNRLLIAGARFGNVKTKVQVAITGIPSVEVVFCSDTMIWVETSDTSTLALGALTASVSHDLYGAYGGLIQVGTVVSAISVPTIVGQTTTLLSNATTLTFDTTNAGSTAADMKLYLSAQFQPDTPILATITAVSGSTVTASLSGMTDIHVGMLNAMMTVKGVKSLTAQVGVVALVKPSITPGFFQIAKSGTGNRIEVAGIRFGSDAGLVSIVLAPAVAGASIVYCSDELLVVDIGDTNSLSTTTMTATVTRTDSGGTQVSDTRPIGTIIHSIAAPSLLATQPALQSHAASTSIDGSAFGEDPQELRAYIVPGLTALVVKDNA